MQTITAYCNFLQQRITQKDWLDSHEIVYIDKGLLEKMQRKSKSISLC